MKRSWKDGGWQIILVTTVLIAAAVTHAVISLDSGGEETVRLVIRQTARISIVLFSAAFAASSLVRLWPATWSRWMMRHRRWLGLSFALSHAVHLAAIIRLGTVAPAFEVDMTTRIFGGMAYVFIALMAATSFDGAVRLLGTRNWQRLHEAGSYYIWFIFVQSYLPRALESAPYVAPTLLLFAALGVRMAARARRDQRLNAAKNTSTHEEHEGHEEGQGRVRI